MPRSSTIAATLAGLTGLAGAGAMNLWIDRRTRPFRFSHVAELPHREVAIVLGARVHPDGRPSTALRDRLAAALELVRSERVDGVVVSGDAHAPEHDEPSAMRRWLLDHGVPAECIRVDPGGSRTLETMRRAADLLDVRTAVVCTQAFHLARAVFLARRCGIDAVGLATEGRYRTRAQNRLREVGAKSVAFVESYLLGRTGRRAC